MLNILGQAYAADSTTAPTVLSQTGTDMSTIMNFLPLLFIFAIFYFLIIRPQQRKMDDQAKLVKALKKGDKIVTSGGLVGTIQRADDEQMITLLIAKDVEVQVLRSAVTTFFDDKTSKDVAEKLSSLQKK